MTQQTATAPHQFGEGGEVFIENAARAAAFHAEHGRHPEPGSRDHDESLLGSWLNRQRKAFAQKHPLMGPARAAHLDEIYPAWRLPAKA